MKTILLLFIFISFGCVNFPTQNDFNDYEIDPPLDRNAPTCGASNFYNSNKWIPALDSNTICPDGSKAIQTGYAVAPIDGSCLKGMYSLNNYHAYYGCMKNQ